MENKNDTFIGYLLGRKKALNFIGALLIMATLILITEIIRESPVWYFSLGIYALALVVVPFLHYLNYKNILK